VFSLSPEFDMVEMVFFNIYYIEQLY